MNTDNLTNSEVNEHVSKRIGGTSKNYIDSMGDAWCIVDELIKRGYRVSLISTEIDWKFNIWDIENNNHEMAYGLAPMAICLAFLKLPTWLKIHKDSELRNPLGGVCGQAG